MLLRRRPKRQRRCLAASHRRSVKWRTRTRLGPLRSESAPRSRTSRWVIIIHFKVCEIFKITEALFPCSLRCRPPDRTACRVSTTTTTAAVHLLYLNRRLFPRRSPSTNKGRRVVVSWTEINTKTTDLALHVNYLLACPLYPHYYDDHSVFLQHDKEDNFLSSVLNAEMQIKLCVAVIFIKLIHNNYNYTPI